jgi:hypothetical protein
MPDSHLEARHAADPDPDHRTDRSARRGHRWDRRRRRGVQRGAGVERPSDGPRIRLHLVRLGVGATVAGVDSHVGDVVEPPDADAER